MKDSKTILQDAFPFLNSEDLDALLIGSRQRTLVHKENISNEGDRIKSLHFIVEGMVRGFFIDDNGEERTIIIRPTKTFLGSPGILQGATHSKYTFEAIQETHLIEIVAASFLSLSEIRLGISRLFTEILKENLQTVFFRVNC